MPTRDARATLFAVPFALAALAVFAVHARTGLRLPAFGDEAGHFLGAQAIHRGDVLYRDYVDAHGPVVFMLTQGWGMLHGFRDLGSARAVPVALTLLAVAAVAGSPALPNGTARLVAAATWLGLVAAAWVMQGLALDDYFSIGGAFLVAEAALVALPLARGIVPGRWAAASGGFAAPFACLSAYAFAPTALLLLAPVLLPADGDARRARRAMLAGFAAAILVNCAWILAYADPVGLLVFHVIVNQTDYARYLGYTGRNLLLSLLPSVAPRRIAQSLGVLAFVAGAAFLLARSRPGRRPVALARAAVLVGVALLDARLTAMFQDGTLLECAFALFALGLGEVAGRAPARALVIGASVVAGANLATRHALSSPFDLSRAALFATPPAPLGPADDELSARIRALTGPDDRILVLPYAPQVYENAGRLSMRGYHDYLPWEADYARHPWWGRGRDLCHDLARDPPKLVWYDGLVIWGAYRPENFMPCVLATLHRLYRPDAVLPQLLVRRDVPDGR